MLIALEEHMLPPELADEVAEVHGQPPGIRAALTEWGERRLAVMDEAGIDVQVLSVVAPGSQEVPEDRAVDVARRLNDATAAAVAEQPDRFRALASLPTQQPDAAAEEARRAIEELGFAGVIVQGHTDGHFLDEPAFGPLLSMVETLGVPVYLHPTYPPQAVFDAYYRTPDPRVGQLLSIAGWGWHAETGMHILRMAAGGVFDRHPALQVVVGHMGENLPFSLMRADSILTPVTGRSVAQAVLDHVHLTTCGYTTVPPLLCALQVFGADRILFSADYPFGDSVEHAAFLRTAPISPTDREKVAHRNAEALFRL